MVQKILNYSISLLLCLLCSLPVGAQNSNPPAAAAQKLPKKEQKDAKEGPQYPLYNGVSVGVDLWGLGSKALGGNTLSTEVVVDVDLKHRFFPTVELGYASNNEEGDLGIRYKTQAPYVRIGIDYNALYKKQHGHLFTVGVRYGMTNFKYDIEALGLEDPIYGGGVGNPNLTDDIWGGSLPYNHTGMKGSMQWLEICLGIRANIWKNVSMGWSVRMKYKLSATTGQYGDPSYIPGFGKYGSNTMGVIYTITYKLPF